MALGQLCRTKNCKYPAMRDSAYCEECRSIRFPEPFVDDINSEGRVIPKLKAAAEASKGIISDNGEAPAPDTGVVLGEDALEVLGENALEAMGLEWLRLIRDRAENSTSNYPEDIANDKMVVAAVDVLFAYAGAVE